MSKMMSISENTAKNLDELAKTLGKSKQVILERALQAYTREQFLKKTNEEYVHLKHDKKAYSGLKEEVQEWDITLSDGLPDER